MKNIVIIGAGDLGKEVVWLIEDINKIKPTYVILGFLDDDIEKENGSFYGYNILGKTDFLKQLSKTVSISAVIAIQDGSIREKIVTEHNYFNNWETIIHPTAVISSSSYIGKGNIIFPFVTVSVNSNIGDFSLCYIRSTVCNDCKVGHYVSLMTGASVLEHAEIGDGCFLSAGSSIYPHKKLGERSNVSVEATVSRDYGNEVEISEKKTGFSLFK